ncbi:MAG: transcription termination/antitermination protein NusG [Treponema sp.]|nr:transcription termination/antitermination protein NusG [Treponema sp.]
MATGWYVIHIYSGYEKRIEKQIRKMIETGEIEKDIVRDVKIPTEEIVEVKDGKKRSFPKKLLPGYILVEMDLPDTDMGWKIPCSKIKKIDGVTGFVGTQAGRKPQPLTSSEARAILQKTGEIKGDRMMRARQSFSAGEQVKIIDGPFESFIGTIDEVYPEKNKLKVMVGIFGRNAPVEVDILQVEKL